MSTFEYYIEENDFYCKCAKGKPAVNGQEFHDYDEFVMFLGGNAHFIAEDVQATLTPNDLIWVPREHFHQFIVSDPTSYIRCIVAIKKSSPLYPLLSMTTNHVSVGRPNEKAQSIFSDIINAMTSSLVYDEKILLLRALITQLTFEKKQHGAISSASISTTSALVSNAISYIDANLDNNLTIQKIASYLYVSESTLSHRFHKELNISIYHYITKKRLSMVRQYVSNGYSIGQAAILSGFNNYASFFRVCKSHYGMSPSQFLSTSY